MLSRFLLPLLAVAGLAFAGFQVWRSQQPLPPSQPVQAPAASPPGLRTIAGLGMIEPARRNIPIGTPVAGVVDSVEVIEGDEVRKGDVLFVLNTDELQAEKRVQEKVLAAAGAELARLRAGYRDEDRQIAAESLNAAEARYRGAQVQYERTAGVFQRGAGTQSEYDRDRYARDEAKAALDRAKAENLKVKNGTWIEDIRIAEAAVARAQEEVARIQTEIDRRTIKTPADGKVLQVNLRPGQFAALAWNEPLIVMGDDSVLHVRVDIDEQDVPLLLRGGKAVATLKGRPGVRFELYPVRIDPFVIPKRNLAGDNIERVDTRVLQVIYRLPPRSERPVEVYVGQQMDVYMEADPQASLDLSMTASRDDVLGTSAPKSEPSAGGTEQPTGPRPR
jgi:multidrug resistance efflux pump